MLKNPDTRARVLYAALLIPSLLVLGAMAGGAIGGRTSSGMGWDQMADVMGGMMLGAAGGIVMGVVLARRLSRRALRYTSTVIVIAATIVAGSVAWRIREANQAARAEQQALPRRPTPPAPPLDN